jgi:DNA-binding NarL/FixJ family response regulator
VAGNIAPTRSVLVVDDDAMARSWVELALEETEFRIAGSAETAAAAEALAERRRPDLLLVDYRLPDRTGVELTRALRTSGMTTPVVLMTANAERGFNELAREAGAQGTVLKTGHRDELLEALRAVADGATVFDGRYPKRERGQAALSPREREVLRLIAAGATNPEIAETLNVTNETVKTLVGRTLAKLGARRRAEAVSAAHELGLL